MGSIDKTFQQPRFQSITALEIPGDLPGAERPDPGSQILAVDPGSDEKAVHMEHARSMLHTWGLRPPDPSVSILEIERGAAKADGTQPTVIGSHQIAQLPSDQTTLVQRVFPQHQLIP